MSARSALLAMSLAAAAALVATPGSRAAGGRLRRPPTAGVPEVGRRNEPPKQPASWLLATACGLAVAAVAGGSSTIVLGPAAFGVALAWSTRRARAAAAADRRRVAADLPLTAELLRACLVAGSPPEAAADAVADAVGGEIGAELRRVTSTMRLGGDPASCWQTLAANDVLAPVGRAFARAVETGAPLSDLLGQVAVDTRQRRASEAVAAARRVGVQAAAPLGLCFLPAFVLLAVVPVVAGLVRALTLT